MLSASYEKEFAADMIASIEGTCVYASSGRVVLELNGIGYDICVSELFSQRCEIDRQYRLLTIMQVHDSEVVLYGFATVLEREFFKMLTLISGVGPKLALKVLSRLKPSEIAVCMAEGDVEALKSVPGVGLKTARRMILELQEKISAMAAEFALPDDGHSSGRKRGRTDSGSSAKESKWEVPIAAEAEAVLLSLGCRPEEAEQAIRAALEVEVPETADALVMAAFSQLQGQ